MNTTTKIGLAGSGSFLPSTVISNGDIARLIGRDDKDADWAVAKLGITERRFMTRLDSTGRPLSEADELDMAEQAAREAIANSGMAPDEVDGVWYVSCTQFGHRRHHFSRSALMLQQRLGLRNDSITLEMDAGCGGALHAMVLGSQLISGKGMDNMLIVASNGPSRYYKDWEAYVASDEWLPMYIFGDGAGATMLRRTRGIESGSEIIASTIGNDPSQPLMYYEPAPNHADPIYMIDGRGVAVGFGVYAKRALDDLRKAVPFDWSDVSRFYFHQVNGEILRKFVAKMDIPIEKVAMHVDRYGNIAAASTLVLIDEDRKQGRIQDGDLCVICAVGAGAQYGAILARL